MVNYKNSPKGNYKEKLSRLPQKHYSLINVTFSLMWKQHFLSYEDSKNSKLQKIALKAITKTNCPGFHKNTIFLINVTFSLIWRQHFWSYECSKNGKLQKISTKGNYKENRRPLRQKGFHFHYLKKYKSSF